MAEVHNTNPNGTFDTTNAKKRKGFWSKIFGRSSNAAEKKDEGGFVNSFMNNARQQVKHIAEDEARKQVEAQLDNNNGSQPTDTTTTAADPAPDTSTATATATTTTPSDVLNAPTNWAKRVADSAQQKMQGLQSLGS